MYNSPNIVWGALFLAGNHNNHKLADFNEDETKTKKISSNPRFSILCFIFFFSTTLKKDTNYGIAWMGLNFYDYICIVVSSQ
jgi:hypothetical protein